MGKKFQHDFFGDEYREKKRQTLEFLSKYSKHRFLPHLRIPTEYIVIIAIGVLILMIIVYAIGVERGKRIQVAQLVERTISKTQVLENKRLNATTPAESPGLKEDIPRVAEHVEERAVKVEREITEPVRSIYSIQLASFRKVGNAKEEVKELKERGYNASYSKSGSWYQVYVTGYRTMKDALKAKKKLVKSYKDCYIRQIK